MTFNMKARRAGWLLVIAAFAFGIVSAIRPAPAAAYGLISTRSIKMSSSIAGATNTIYTVGFTPATSGETVGSIAIHFCGNNPIIGDTTCTVPAGLATNYTTLSLNNFLPAASGFAISQTLSNSTTVVLTRTPSAWSGTTPISFDLGNGTTNGFTNPTTNGTFYARITLYSANNPSFTDAATAGATEATATDAGGDALATTVALSVTAKVQEQLTFCVYTTASCGGGVGNGDIKMGDSNGVLADVHQTYLDASTHMDLASNALGGVIIRMKGDTLKSGSFSIDPEMGAGPGDFCTTDPPSTDTSTEAFGVRIVSLGTGQGYGQTGYYDCVAGSHMFDVTGANTTYGEPFISTTGATDLSTDNIELAAKAANTTEAGIYTTTLQFIATATY